MAARSQAQTGSSALLPEGQLGPLPSVTARIQRHFCYRFFPVFYWVL
jgi:hypothetical protein